MILIVIQRQFFLPDTSLLRFGFKLIIVNLQRSMQNVFTDRVLPIMTHWDKILGGGGGGGHFVVQILRQLMCLFCFHPDFAFH